MKYNLGLPSSRMEAASDPEYLRELIGKYRKEIFRLDQRMVRGSGAKNNRRKARREHLVSSCLPYALTLLTAALNHHREASES